MSDSETNGKQDNNSRLSFKDKLRKFKDFNRVFECKPPSENNHQTSSYQVVRNVSRNTSTEESVHTNVAQQSPSVIGSLVSDVVQTNEGRNSRVMIISPTPILGSELCTSRTPLASSRSREVNNNTQTDEQGQSSVHLQLPWVRINENDNICKRENSIYSKHHWSVDDTSTSDDEPNDIPDESSVMYLEEYNTSPILQKGERIGSATISQGSTKVSMVSSKKKDKSVSKQPGRRVPQFSPDRLKHQYPSPKPIAKRPSGDLSSRVSTTETLQSEVLTFPHALELGSKLCASRIPHGSSLDVQENTHTDQSFFHMPMPKPRHNKNGKSGNRNHAVHSKHRISDDEISTNDEKPKDFTYESSVMYLEEYNTTPNDSQTDKHIGSLTISQEAKHGPTKVPMLSSKKKGKSVSKQPSGRRVPLINSDLAQPEPIYKDIKTAVSPGDYMTEEPEKQDNNSHQSFKDKLQNFKQLNRVFGFKPSFENKPETSSNDTCKRKPELYLPTLPPYDSEEDYEITEDEVLHTGHIKHQTKKRNRELVRIYDYESGSAEVREDMLEVPSSCASYPPRSLEGIYNRDNVRKTGNMRIFGDIEREAPPTISTSASVAQYGPDEEHGDILPVQSSLMSSPPRANAAPPAQTELICNENKFAMSPDDSLTEEELIFIFEEYLDVAKLPTHGDHVLKEDEVQTDTLQEEIDSLQEERTCKMCLQKEVAVAFIPCGHAVACEDCTKQLNHCAVCRSPIQTSLRIYMN